jgi:hypothetical protein
LLTPLKKLEEDDRPIIEKRIIGQIFSNIETLVAVNKELLIRLEERMQNWADTQRLADIFNTMVGLYNIIIILLRAILCEDLM